ncbi:hypothetical protein AB0N38_33600 [Micromonospora aurantiaca]|jgi:hypothetical protein|uniref:Uncharacterized protein n=1 Tax=Micromonospora aurantiaca (nom. illeg.) TaxID=47850 RepID=A0A3M9K1Q0_9ACTN|nr:MULTISPECIES: hypothetical protein [Micromonospora]AXH93682.1 hypothetical protein DVH21_29325 [Micromonospora aurantiaca]KAB1108448.1 hypothetical protein F6X54_22570 [Micromonospora aurantiaca]MBC9006352.1 hypothetical protein [Micromonospora aurantiaca]MDG4752862.1 hypothetical protein [Micromonospora sp. WMMD718]RNH94117.1 hypothetical protein EEZ25_32080 [Micromonospora aurantiaca]
MDSAYGWGIDEPPNPAADTDADGLEPEQLSEVRELTAQGWQLAPDAHAPRPTRWPAQRRAVFW